LKGTISLLVNNPKIIEHYRNTYYFNRCLHQGSYSQCATSSSLLLNMRPAQAFFDCSTSTSFKTVNAITIATLNIRFSGAEVVDSGGVTREWFQVLARQMFDPNYALFLPIASDRTTFHPNPMCGVNPEHLSFFKFIGRIIGKALYEGRVLDCHFS